jgi:AraC family transcriptional regulator, transcriptional activator of pobA
MNTNASIFSLFRHAHHYHNNIYIAHGYDSSRQQGDTVTASTGGTITFCICHCGRAAVKTNNYVREMTAGQQIALYPHTTLTTLRISTDFDCSIISISPDFQRGLRYSKSLPLVDALTFFRQQTILNLPPEQQEFFVKMRDLMVLALNTLTDPYRYSLLEELTHSFLLWQQTVIASLLKSSFAAANNDDILTAKFLSLVNDNYRMRHRLEFYASQMCISPKYLSATTKRSTGHTANQWISIFLIGEAQNLLTNSTMSVAEITDALGFSNQSFFGKFFKRHTGKSPLAYRLDK